MLSHLQEILLEEVENLMKPWPESLEQNGQKQILHCRT